ncbi:hypothetical protein GF362_03265 [Candidatus Dojkabacteria bacterium]|nr:hypothetical protein [Candidatus Dojkabacteria bacterium]
MNQSIHRKFIKKAIKLSNVSQKQGRFPAGALVVLNNDILAEEISSPYPDHRHADSKAIDNSFEKINGKLTDAVLYSSMIPCLMCISRAYWAGIRKIVYACSQLKVNLEYFETHRSIQAIVDNFDQEIELIHLSEFEKEALEIIKEWEENS